jgi:hypothetical protein
LLVLSCALLAVRYGVGAEAEWIAHALLVRGSAEEVEVCCIGNANPRVCWLSM